MVGETQRLPPLACGQAVRGLPGYLSTADAHIDIIRVLHGVRDLERLFDDEDAGGSETET